MKIEGNTAQKLTPHIAQFTNFVVKISSQKVLRINRALRCCQALAWKAQQKLASENEGPQRKKSEVNDMSTRAHGDQFLSNLEKSDKKWKFV